MRFLTAGESHGRGLIAVLEGMPAGVRITRGMVAGELKRRQHGVGRSERMRKRTDKPIILSGIRHGETIGSPISVYIPNGEREKWMKVMSPRLEEASGGIGGEISRPRPGHADLAGALKYGRRDIRDILERASARETASRVALGACAKAFLGLFGIVLGSYVVGIGKVKGRGWYSGIRECVLSGERSLQEADSDPVRFMDREVSSKVVDMVNAARKAGETLGGIFEIIILGVPVGLGSYTHWDRRLDSRLAGGVMSIPGVKGVEIGPAFENAGICGSSVHDTIHFDEGLERKGSGGFFRKTNRAGGIEGGISNGEEIVLRVAMKPLPTLKKPLASVDLKTLEPDVGAVERSDVCAVPAAGVVGESVTAMVLADLFLEKFSGDTVREVEAGWKNYLGEIGGLFSHRRRDPEQ